MFKPFILGAFLSLPGLAWAEPVGILAGPSETIRVSSPTAHMTVFFDADRDRYNVTMIFTDLAGDVLRTRVTLADAQSHAVIFRAEETEERTEFKVERVGRYVGVHVTDLDAAVDVGPIAGGAGQDLSKVR